MPPPLVIVTEPIPEAPAAWLAERARVVHAMPGEPLFDDAIGHAQALVVRTYTIVGEPLLARAPALRAVGRAGVGLDNIDVAACRARGVAVFSTPAANTTAVVEYVFALILERLRPVSLEPRGGGGTEPPWVPPLLPVTAPLDLPAWETARPPAPRELNECTLGLLGFGRIGSRVGRVARAFGCRVLYHDLLDIPDNHGCEPDPPERVLAEADILSLHVDGRPSNRNLLGAARLARLKPDCTIINTSRGLVIDEPALAAWLAEHPRAAALLDVHQTEPITAHHPLLATPNARLFPHAGASTRPAKERMGWVVRDVWECLAR